jgi:hypothetical protein
MDPVTLGLIVGLVTTGIAAIVSIMKHFKSSRCCGNEVQFNENPEPEVPHVSPTIVIPKESYERPFELRIINV